MAQSVLTNKNAVVCSNVRSVSKFKYYFLNTVTILFASKQNSVIWIYRVILLSLNAFQEPKSLKRSCTATQKAYTTFYNVNSSSYIFLAQKIYILRVFGRIT